MSLPRSTSKIEFSISFTKRSFTLPYLPKIICEVIGSLRDCVPTIGKTLNCSPFISNVETKLLVILLNVAPTVIAFGFIPGLPIVLNSGPKFPAAVTTKILFSIALFTVLSIFVFVWFIPKLILIILAPSSIDFSIALIIKLEGTDSPSSETLYAKIFEFGAIPLRLPFDAMIPATSVP